MSIDVTVLRVFTDSAGDFGNPLGVVDAAAVEPEQHQRIATQLGYSETIFVDLPTAHSATADARIYTPKTELPFAGHPTVGASWWLQDIGMPIRTLRVPAGVVHVSYDNELTFVSARSEWAPDFAIHDLASLDDLAAAVRITDYLSRDLSITQGKGSLIDTVWNPQGWIQIAGRVINDGVRQVS